MSLATNSPAHSSSSDDFAAFLDVALDSHSSDSSPYEKAEGDNNAESERIKRRKVEKLENSEEDILYGVEEQSSEAISKQQLCSHPGSFGNMCIICGQRLDEESGVTFGYIHKGLRLNNDEINRLRNIDMKSLLLHKKLILVLDLDHTLLNSTQLGHLTPEEEYLRSQTDSLDDVTKGSLFLLNSVHTMTKLRPFVHSFLKEANQLFEMYIYTMGERAYAFEMAKLLDPKKEYFNGKVISRDDGTQKHQKGLDVVLGQESAVLILDDTENAWPKHKKNLILMERYHFFASSCHQFGFNCKSLSELKSDESETDGALATILKVLKQVHSVFFNELSDDLVDRDVRQILKTVRSKVLEGCKVVFSRVFPTKFQADNHHLWKMVEQLGGTCSTELDQSVTHVVSMDAGTEKSRWALKEEKFLVHPRWIEASNYFWKRQSEENFPVEQTKKQ
ncbi:RNA polymerase II C-terminal domain phosphatase-like 4 isoform X1 [Benincasa hispida]|uniref:RNA polymerase II C-terminal domain phosphatase-like 4 isoform X1 n=2 Tax=Benincasa hispida TaxID=102211 RepID=UPI0018FFF269|nr:RNA polymerase II C-terminal domain phosphatase-like 4 isoform X1 [Benincasa hispida]XP_038890382.1 RNA polymerase II C-terminal domain phosphatase-like 4 isoform X1 [Benincasa hispida]